VAQWDEMASTPVIVDQEVEVWTAETPDALRDIGALFREYASSLGVAVSMREIAAEIDSLPGEYGGPAGALLVAYANGVAGGCVALRPLADGECEMRRLWVRHPHRGRGLGRQLAIAAVEQARQQRYRVIRLHTAPWMKEAIELYRSLGFVITESYRETPIAGATFMALALD
jgi:ribosomal protein S18 acetylase RimI-like enzyme